MDAKSNLKGRLELVASFLSEAVLPVVLEDVHQMVKNYVDAEAEKMVEGKKRTW